MGITDVLLSITYGNDSVVAVAVSQRSSTVVPERSALADHAKGTGRALASGYRSGVRMKTKAKALRILGI